ncbi:hypothetical protein [Maribellus sediminis]|uniref:hypothetical protein n=1 Tax=Maribellus sediminis TaxID=2696285 RepID=UPI001431214A|nr:hypothetical protein [Maribellus sediminis]
MKNKIFIGTTLVGLIIGGIAYWFQPYNRSTVLGINMYLIMSLGAFFASFLLRVFGNEKPPKIALLVSLGIALAVIARIIYDTTFFDSTSHNLAPFEIIICGIITIPSAFAGTYLGLLFKKINKRDNK